MATLDTYDFTDQDFEYLRRVATSLTGIKLNESKRAMIYGRVLRRIRQLGIGSFAAYCELLREPDSRELPAFVNAITTNVTKFFREEHHFELLAKQILPEALARNARDRRLRIWSAGCSRGHEPYSIAMVLEEGLPRGATWNARILATDIDSNVLDEARAAVYRDQELEPVLASHRSRFLEAAPEAPGSHRIRPAVARHVAFKQLNLMGEWPMRGPFDAIFCRNVVIYFDKPTQEVLFNRFAELLCPGGCLFIGHSESLFGLNVPFTLMQRSVYRVERGGAE